MDDLKHKTDYHTLFDTAAYLDTFWKDPEQWEGLPTTDLPFNLSEHHKFWSTTYESASSDGATVLEFGGGPAIANVISAAKKASRIVFSEYTESNRKAVSSWINNEPKAHDWSPFIRYVVQQLEGDFKEEAVSLRTQELRSKIASVIPCDMTRRPMVDVDESFDVVATSFCVEDVCSSFADYKDAVCQLCKLIKPGGYLHMACNLNESYYVVGEHKFRVLPLTKEMVEEALKNAGMMVVDSQVMQIDWLGTSSASAVFSVNGRKDK